MTLRPPFLRSVLMSPETFTPLPCLPSVVQTLALSSTLSPDRTGPTACKPLALPMSRDRLFCIPTGKVDTRLIAATSVMSLSALELTLRSPQALQLRSIVDSPLGAIVYCTASYLLPIYGRPSQHLG